MSPAPRIRAAEANRSIFGVIAVCGRYVTKDQAAMERAFSVIKPWWRFEASYNVAPTQSVPIVRLTEGGREGVMMRWGLIPFFAEFRRNIPQSTLGSRPSNPLPPIEDPGNAVNGAYRSPLASTSGIYRQRARSNPISFRSRIRISSGSRVCGIAQSKRTAKRLRAAFISLCPATR